MQEYSVTEITLIILQNQMYGGYEHDLQDKKFDKCCFHL